MACWRYGGSNGEYVHGAVLPSGVVHAGAATVDHGGGGGGPVPVHPREVCRVEDIGYALGGVEDHVHLVVSVPVDLALADFVERVKGSSSHFINHLPGEEARLYWQTGYGALTFAKRELPRVAAYAENQKTHHREGSLSEKMERIAEAQPASAGFLQP
jgi:hypothetical protein